MKTLVLLIACCITVELYASTDEPYLENAVDNCVTARAPGICMEDYGFECDWIGHSSSRAGDGSLGCNAPMSDGRKYFAQLNTQDGGWVIHVREAYLPETHINWSGVVILFGTPAGIVVAMLLWWRRKRKGHFTAEETS